MAGEHLPTAAEIASWGPFTEEHPLALLVSGCLMGVPCGVYGSSYGAPYAHLDRLLALPNVKPVWFCPEDFAFGTPRQTPDIHGGTGEDVLVGRARVLSESGEDWTVEMLEAAKAMVGLAQRHKAPLALLMDISAACGSQVIYRGARSDGIHQAGHGVAAALLIQNGVKILSQRDRRTLGRLVHALDPTFVRDPDAMDHHETDWYREHFG
jgi:uncharacterized protein YbbK (DUF523 family)